MGKVVNNPIEFLLFDMDGVISDSSPCHAAAYKSLWEELDITAPPYDKIAGRATREVVLQYTAALNPTREQIAMWVETKQQTARALLATEKIIFPDSGRAIRSLHRKGFQMAIATSASPQSARLILRRCDVTDYFPTVITGEAVSKTKPAPDIFLNAASRAGFAMARTLVIEDSASGIEAGLGSGARVVSVRSGITASHERFLGSYKDLDAIDALLQYGVGGFTC